MTIYFDYNATAPLRPEARAAWLAATGEAWGNAASVHAAGQTAAGLLEAARRELAGRLQCEAGELTFNSGATEGANHVLHAVLAAGGHAIVSAIEHHAVLEPAQALARRGQVAVDFVRPGADGRVDPAALTARLRPDTRLVALMAVNNETGVIQDVPALAAALAVWNAAHPAADGSGGLVGLLCDATQAAGKIDPAQFAGADWVVLSGHKFGAPKGVGALIARRTLPALFAGGNAEGGLRAGTVAVELAAALAAAFAAAEHDRAQETERLAALRDWLESGLAVAADAAGLTVTVAGAAAPRVSNTSFVCFPGRRAETLVMNFDLAGLCTSTGAACVQGAAQPSHVLQAMGLPPEQIAGAVRFSLGSASTEADVDRAVAIVRQVLGRA
ncbi:MAG: cysteine desulfurase family protein [Planctomycetota bacterium]